MLDPDTLCALGMAAASWPYWRRWELRAPAPVLEPELDEYATWLEAQWAAHVSGPNGLLPNSRLVDVEQIPDGWRATIVCAPGGRQTTRSAMNIAPQLTAALLLPADAVDIRPTHDRNAARAVVTVMQENPLFEDLVWPGLTFDPATGLYKPGRYVDGMTSHMQLYIPGSGAVNWLIAGAPGMGKTAFLQTMLSETSRPRFVDADGVERALFHTFLGDGKGGNSFPEWKRSKALGYYAETPRNIMRMLRSTVRIMRRREYDLSNLEWVDDRGRQRRGISHFDPVLARRGYVRCVVDEWPKFLKRLLELPGGVALKQEAIRLGIEIAQGGRSLGVALVLCGQNLGQDEMGSADLRRLVAGNVLAFKTRSSTEQGMAFAGGMAGCEPHELPETQPDPARPGETIPLQGMTYLYGPDGRRAMHRTWVVADPFGYAQAAPDSPLHPSDAEAGGYDLAMWRDRLDGAVSDDDPEPKKTPAEYGGQSAPVAVVEEPSAVERRRALILEVVGDGPTKLAAVLAASATWDPVPSQKTIQNDLRALEEGGLISQPGGRGKPYVKGSGQQREAA
jgi:hypothetical protein